MKNTNVKKLFMVVIAVVLAFALQTTVLKQIPYFNIAPNLMLVVVCTFGLLYGKIYGLWIGFAVGMLADLFYGGGIIGLYALIYMYIGFLNGLLSEVLLKDVVFVPVLFLIGSEVCYHGYVYIFTYALRNRLNVLEYLKTIMIPELLLTIVGMIVIYGLLMWINRKLDEAEEKKGEERIA